MYKIQDTRYKMHGMRNKMQDIEDTRCKEQETRYEIQDKLLWLSRNVELWILWKLPTVTDSWWQLKTIQRLHNCHIIEIFLSIKVSLQSINLQLSQSIYNIQDMRI